MHLKIASALRERQFGQKSPKRLHVPWVFPAWFTVRGVMMPPMDEQHQEDRLLCVFNMSSRSSELPAVPEIAFFIQLDERKLYRTNERKHCFLEIRLLVC